MMDYKILKKEKIKILLKYIKVGCNMSSDFIKKYEQRYHKLQEMFKDEKPLSSKYLYELLKGMETIQENDTDFFEKFFYILEIDSKIQLLEFFMLENELEMSEYEVINVVDSDYKMIYKEITDDQLSFSIINGLENRQPRFKLASE